MRELPWFRFYSDAYTDTKFQRIARDMQLDPMAVIGAWVVVLCLAARAPVRGGLFITEQEPYTDADLASVLGWDETAVKRFMKQCETLGMYDSGTHLITNWHKRQYSSDVSTDRVAKYREKQGAVADEKQEGNVSETAPDTDTDTETESDTELKDTRDASDLPTKNIYQLFTENIKPLTLPISNKLKDLEDDYGAEWVADAIKVAVLNNAKDIGYIMAVLKNRRNGTTPRQAWQAKKDKQLLERR